VGTGLLQLLAEHGPRLTRSVGRSIEVAGVSARSRAKKRGAALGEVAWFDDAERLAAEPSIDVFVELIGGDEGVAKAAVETALRAGKPVVTANKALLARHGIELAKLAEKSGVALNFEAAVAGGIPVIKTLREALAANQIRRVYGILNGTCNYILTQMQEEHRSFGDVLAEAQAKGYAEADPTNDVDGFDAAYKLSILVSLLEGRHFRPDQVRRTSLRTVSSADADAATARGARIRYLAVADFGDKATKCRVGPEEVPADSLEGQATGPTNVITLESDMADRLVWSGPGAGGDATASAILADVIAIARSSR
jgi:homoserine dehydrogenase